MKQQQSKTGLYIILGAVVLATIAILVYFFILKKDSVPAGEPAIVSEPVQSGTPPSIGPVAPSVVPVPFGSPVVPNRGPIGSPVIVPVPSVTPNRGPVVAPVPSGSISGLTVLRRSITNVILKARITSTSPITVKIYEPNATTVHALFNNVNKNALNSVGGVDLSFLSSPITVPGTYSAELSVDGVSESVPFIINFGKPVVTNVTSDSITVQADVDENTTGNCVILIEGDPNRTINRTVDSGNLQSGVTISGLTLDTTKTYYVSIITPESWNTLNYISSETSNNFTIPVPSPGPV